MIPDWALAKHGYGVIVLQSDSITVLEFNEFLGRIADGRIEAQDVIVASVFTDGKRRLVGDLKVYAMARSGELRTDDLPRRVLGGVLATGEAARALLRAVEGSDPGDAETLMRAASAPLSAAVPLELLRAAASALAADPPTELLHILQPPKADGGDPPSAG
ncbi:MAG TPA: hypothetical protein VKT32_14830 [Chthonomonadaceae bacterium]|nr:hypothetical protein [Chthonomonadaceae bacterium]